VDKSIEEVPDEENSDLHPGGAGQEAHTENIGRTKQDQDRKEGKNCGCVDYRDILRGRCCGSHICTCGGLWVGTDAGSWRFKRDRNPIVVAGSKIYFPKWRAVCAARGDPRQNVLFAPKEEKTAASKQEKVSWLAIVEWFSSSDKARHIYNPLWTPPSNSEIFLEFFRFGGLPAPITIPFLEEQIEARWKRKNPVNPIAFPALETL